MRLAREKDFDVIPFVPPVNYERGRELFEDKFEQAYQYNYDILENVIVSEGYKLLDLSHICTKEMFAHVTTPDETTNYDGRLRVASYICDAILKIKEV